MVSLGLVQGCFKVYCGLFRLVLGLVLGFVLGLVLGFVLGLV